MQLAPHRILGIQPDADLAAIRSAFKRLALQCHPDKSGGDADRFRAIAAAYEAMASSISKNGGGGSGKPFDWANLFSTDLQEEMTANQMMRKACLADDAHTVAKLLMAVRDDEGSCASFVNAVDEAGLTPLKYACMAGSSECATLLIDSSAAVDQTSSVGVTALFEACRAGQEGCVRTLLERSASVNHTNDTGHTPLMFATIKGCEACVRLLCAHGAEREARTHEKGITAAEYARKLKRPAELAAYLDGTLERLTSEGGGGGGGGEG